MIKNNEGIITNEIKYHRRKKNMNKKTKVQRDRERRRGGGELQFHEKLERIASSLIKRSLKKRNVTE